MRIDAPDKDHAVVPRIFLIDSDVISRSVLYYMLADTCKLHEFSGSEIADIRPRLKPDLVIVNAMLVAGHGKQLLQSWRIAWPDAKVLVICEACDTECELAAQAAGAHDTLLRPFKLEAVQRKVAQWIERPAAINIPRIASPDLLHAGR